MGLYGVLGARSRMLYNCLLSLIHYLPDDGQRERPKHVVDSLCNKLYI